METDTLVLDANVLIAADATGWFEHLEFWADTHTVATAKAIWGDEFAPGRDFDNPPGWLSTTEVAADEGISGAISMYDWKLLEVAKKHDGVVITADENLRLEAESRGFETKNTAEFFKETFRKCGIPEEDYRTNLDKLIEDLWLTQYQSVVDDLHSAEKP